MIYVVAGLPRTGTSMMMAAMEAGGLPVAKSEQRNLMHLRRDGEYLQNRDLYELPVEDLWQPFWPRRHDGKAVKCLARWVRHLAVHKYRVVFMHRDLEEVRQSYRAAFDVHATVDQLGDMERHAIESLENRKDIVSLTHLDYTAVLADPVGQLASLGWPIDVGRAASVVDAAQYRFRRELLTVGL